MLPHALAWCLLLRRKRDDLDTPEEVYFQKPNNILLLAEYGGQIVGLAGVRPATDIDAGFFSPLRKEGDAELAHLSILPRYQGYGFGKILLDEAIEFAKKKGFKRLVLSTSSLQNVARKVLFPKYGFTVEKKTRTYLGLAKLEFMSVVL
jgi:GNAT superfamily N-acetyltransferase